MSEKVAEEDGASGTQFFCFCPGCRRRRPENPDELKSEIGASYVDCCNPECQGRWGTGCYHCHHPSYWPRPDEIYKITATLQEVEGSGRIIEALIRDESVALAQIRFTETLKDCLTVEDGLVWRMVVEVEGSLRPDRHYYAHHMLRGVVYNEQAAPPEPDPTQMASKPKPEKKMTRGEAKLALEAYFRQELEADALYLIEAVVNGLVEHPDREVSVMTQGWDLAFPRHARLKNMTHLELGQVKGPAWLSRFKGLIEDVRTELGLHDTESSDAQNASE